MWPVQSLSLAQARRVALAAQGFLDPPHAAPTMRTFARTLQRTGVLQVDSVNVLQRAHYMPLYSRMGPYDVDLLRRAAEREPRRVVEYWAHVQAFMPVELWPVMQHRMEHYREQRGKWWTVEADPGLEANLLAEIRDRGRSTARDLDDGLPRTKEHWGWNWSETRKALDFLFSSASWRSPGATASSRSSTTCPSGCCPPPSWRCRHPGPRGRAPRAGPPCRGVPRRRHRAGPRATTTGCARSR